MNGYIIIFLFTYLITLVINSMLMIMKNKPSSTKYVLVVCLPILNVVFLLYVLLNGLRNYKSYIREILQAFKDF